MVSINKNIFMNLDNGLSLSNSKKNTDELFAELFSILHSNNDLSNLDTKIDSNINKPKDPLDNDLVVENSEVSDLEIEAAKYLAETFYKEIGVIEEEDTNQIDKITEFAPKISKKSDSSKNIANTDQLSKLSFNKLDNEFSKEHNFQVNVRVSKIENKHLSKEKKEVNDFQIMKKISEVKGKEIKNEYKSVTNVQSKTFSSNLIEKKQKKKNKQIFKNIPTVNSEIITSNNNNKITIQTNTSSNISTKKNIENVNSRNINEKIDKIKVPKQTVSNSSEQKILNFMENNWEQKFSSIIRESLKNDINKIEFDVKPKNLGKVRLEIIVEKEVTKIDLTTESIETANLLNENLSKISDFLNEGKENYLSQNKNNNQNFNHQKNNRDSHKQKTLVDNKKEKSPINTINNTNHNIDVNA
jgi:hypothetical protein